MCVYMCVFVCVCHIFCLCYLHCLLDNNIIKRSFSFSFTFAFVFSQCIPVTQTTPLPPLSHVKLTVERRSLTGCMAAHIKIQ